MQKGEYSLIFTILLSVLFLVFLKFSNYFMKKKIVIFSLFLLFTSTELFLNSNLQWSLYDWKTKDTDKKLNLKNMIIKSTNKPRVFSYTFGNEFIRNETYQVNNFANWGMDAHNKIIRKYFKSSLDIFF